MNILGTYLLEMDYSPKVALAANVLPKIQISFTLLMLKRKCKTDKNVHTQYSKTRKLFSLYLSSIF